MRLTPLDIQHMEFERGVSGYRRAQVRAFLERVAAEREELLKELQGLRDELAEQQRRVEALESAEADLRQAVIAAERIGNQMKDNARREAELIVQGAEADRATAEADVARLRTLRDDFREQFRGMLRAYLQSLDVATPHGATDARPGAEGPDEALSEDDLHEGGA
ncbi:MAG: DivIVA domain-containing protein [Deinococcus-Thermus bacterium]|jgi:cell division initiation protein|nr:DivIVA domain-containing protein [Deinococcota bacterium]